MNKDRVLDITLNEKGLMYAMAKKREEYVYFLHKHKHESQMIEDDQMKILEWAKRKIALSSTIQ